MLFTVSQLQLGTRVKSVGTWGQMDGGLGAIESNDAPEIAIVFMCRCTERCVLCWPWTRSRSRVLAMVVDITAIVAALPTELRQTSERSSARNP